MPLVQGAAHEKQINNSCIPVKKKKDYCRKPLGFWHDQYQYLMYTDIYFLSSDFFVRDQFSEMESDQRRFFQGFYKLSHSHKRQPVPYGDAE
jgi:hypothetical protein